MKHESNYDVVYEKLSEINPEFFDPSDSRLNCGWYTSALIEILGENSEREDISDWKELSTKIEEHFTKP